MSSGHASQYEPAICERAESDGCQEDSDGSGSSSIDKAAGLCCRLSTGLGLRSRLWLAGASGGYVLGISVGDIDALVLGLGLLLTRRGSRRLRRCGTYRRGFYGLSWRRGDSFWCGDGFYGIPAAGDDRELENTVFHDDKCRQRILLERYAWRSDIEYRALMVDTCTSLYVFSPARYRVLGDRPGLPIYKNVAIFGNVTGDVITWQAVYVLSAYTEVSIHSSHVGA